MNIERLETKQRMSRIVKHNGVIYLCGQVCADATQDITHQTQTMLDKVDSLLVQAGSDRKHMLSATIYLKTMDDFAKMNEVWDNWVPEGYAPGQDQDLDLAVQLWPQLMAHIQQPFDQSAAYDESIQALINLFNIQEQA